VWNEEEAMTTVTADRKIHVWVIDLATPIGEAAPRCQTESQ